MIERLLIAWLPAARRRAGWVWRGGWVTPWAWFDCSSGSGR